MSDAAFGLKGQDVVLEAWRTRLHGRDFIHREDLPLSAIACELAHVSVLAVERETMTFRLAGSGLRHAFGCESRGKTTDQIGRCDGEAWASAPRQTLGRLCPTTGRTRTSDGFVHFWMRLPMSSDGVTADLVLCHDRYLPLDALADPDRAARAADAAMRLDAVEAFAA